MNFPTAANISDLEGLRNWKSGISILDWMLSKATFGDESDQYGTLLVGNFKGTIRYSAAQELYQIFKDGAYIENTGTFAFDIFVEFGKYRENFNKVSLTIRIQN